MDSPKNILGTMPVATVIQLGVLLFAMGGIWNRFQNLEKDHHTDITELKLELLVLEANLDELEKNKASTGAVNVVDKRLRKYIGRFTIHEKEARDESEEWHHELYKLKYSK